MLTSHVDPEPFAAALRDRANPNDGPPGVDITFSALKTVSLAALLHDDPRVVRAHDKAVRATLHRVEQRLLFVAVRVKGARSARLVPAAGATVLLVSHSGRQIIEVCDRAVMLDRGEKICEGDAKSVVAAYHRYIYAPPEHADEVRDALRRDGPIPPKRDAVVEEQAHQRVSDFDPHMVPESRVDYLPNGAEISGLSLRDETDNPVNLLRRGHRYRIRYLIAFTDRCEDVGAGTLIKTLTGVGIASASTAHLAEMERTGVPGRVTEVVWEFDCNLLWAPISSMPDVRGWSMGVVVRANAACLTGIVTGSGSTG